MKDATEILQRLHDSEINAMVSWSFDRQFRWAIGDDLNGWHLEGRASDVRQAINDLAENAFAEFPRSDFAKWWAQRRHQRPSKTKGLSLANRAILVARLRAVAEQEARHGSKEVAADFRAQAKEIEEGGAKIAPIAPPARSARVQPKAKRKTRRRGRQVRRGSVTRRR